MPQFSDDLFLGSAQTYMGTNVASAEAVFAGSVSATTLTITALLSGDPVVLGQYVAGTGVTAGSYITAFVTGSGGAGTYTLSASSSSTGAITIAISGNALLGDPSPMSLGVGPMGRTYLWDQICQALATNNIAATQTPTTAGNLTLTAGTSVKSIVRADGVTVLQLDCPRAVSVSLVTGGTARAYTVTGYDYYGQAMSEVITSVAAATTAGKKAFFQIVSVSGAGASTTAVTVGTTDVIGIPLRVVDAGYVVSVGFGNTLARDTGTFVAAVTAAATTTTGDVRGTYIPSAANDGIKRIVMCIGLPAIAVGPNATRTGALGVTQA